jgi:hypothetical protein
MANIEGKTIDPDLFYSNKEELKKKFKQEESGIKTEIKQHLPEPIQKMLDTQEGTYALIFIAVIAVILFFKMIGFAFNLFWKILLLFSIASAAFFLYSYFNGVG